MDWGAFTFYRPRLVPVLTTLLLVGLCFALGIWQIQRLQWKEGLIAELTLAQQGAPITNATLPAELSTLTQQNFHPVELSGEFLHQHELHVIGRSVGGEPGFNLYTPMRLSDDERVLLVNRGWVPQNRKAAETRPASQPDGEAEVAGFIAVPQGGSPFLPDHDVQGNIWFWAEMPRINAETGLDMPPVVIEAVDAAATRERLPLPRRDFEVELRNDHLNYALMWFSLAFAGLIIFFLYHRKTDKDEESAPPASKP